MTGCRECGFADVEDHGGGTSGWHYREDRAGQAGRHVLSACDQAARLLVSCEDAQLRVRAQPDRWSTLEYGCHVRDVLLVQRERVLKALRGHGHEFMAMGRDERVEHDGYNGQDPYNVAAQIEQSALMFTSLLDRLTDEDWELTITYMFPDPDLRRLRWVAVHTAHEVVHHLADMQRR